MNKHVLAGALVAIALAGPRAQAMQPGIAPVTITDPMSFLVQEQCPDGAPPFKCANPSPVTQATPLGYRRHDLPNPTGFQMDDSVQMTGATNEAMSTFVFGDFGDWASFKGGPIQLPNDGGELYETDGTNVVVTETKDGGTPTNQFFNGPQCGGTGWLLFRTDAPTGSWASTVAKLNDEPSPSDCPGLGSAYTQYRLENINWPMFWQGRPVSVYVPTAISQHFDGDTIADSHNAEFFYFAKGYGRTLWAAWSNDPARTPSADLADRCPTLPGGGAWNVAPAPGWQMVDCREYVNLRKADGKWSVSEYNWP